MVYGDLFNYSTTEAEIHTQYKRLAMKLHPDRGGTNEEFSTLNTLYYKALDAVKSNSPYWLSSSSIQLNNHQSYEYLWKIETESHTTFSCKEHIVFVDSKHNADLIENANHIIEYCHTTLNNTTNDNIKHTQETIPKFQKYENILVTTKPVNFHPLQLVMSKYVLRPEDVAWIVGRLMHFMNFFEWVGVMHGSISIENIWVDLDHHRIGLFGGWQYSRKYNTKLLALPKESAKFLSGKPIANPNIDRDCIRELIINLFGGKSIASLKMNKQIPRPVIEFLNTPFRKSAFDTYQNWESMRDAGFGPRKFMVFQYTIDQLYSK